MRTKLFLIAGLAASLVACSGDKAPEEEVVTDVVELTSPIAVEAAGGNPAAELAAQQIEGDYMRSIVVEISDDRYEGRGPGTAGDDMTREYLVERIKELGLEPGALLGELLEAVREAQAAGEVSTLEEALAFIRSRRLPAVIELRTDAQVITPGTTLAAIRASAMAGR